MSAYSLVGRVGFLLTEGFTGATHRVKVARADTISLLWEETAGSLGIANPIGMIGGLEELGYCEAWCTATLSGNTGVGLVHLDIKHFAQRIDGVPMGISRQVITILASEIEAGAGTVAALSVPAYDIDEDAVVFSVQTNTGKRWMVKYSLGQGITMTLPAPSTAMPYQCRFTKGLIGIYSGNALGGRIFIVDTIAHEIVYDQSGWSGSGGRFHWDSVSKGLLTSDNHRYNYPQRTSRQAALLGDVVTSLCTRTGLSAADLDVTELSDDLRGYGLARQVSVRGALELLAAAYHFDCVESDHKLEFRKRGREPSRVITQDELVPSNADGEPFLETRAQDVDLPSRFTVRYTDVDQDADVALQTVKRIAAPVATMRSHNEATLDLPLSLTAEEAKEVALRQCFGAWTERVSHEWKLPWTHLDLEPCDVVTVVLNDGRTFNVRVLKADIGADLTLAWETVVEESSTYEVEAVAGGGRGLRRRIVSPSPVSRVAVLDMPLLDDRDDAERRASGLYWLMGGVGQPGWAGGLLFESTDGAMYGIADEAVAEMTYGVARSALPSTDTPFRTDRESTLDVHMTAGTLASATELEMLNGANRALLVKSDGTVEVVAFAGVEDHGRGRYTLSTFLRGLRGTETEVAGHALGDTFILLEDDTLNRLPVPPADLDAARYYRPVGRGGELRDAPTTTVIPVGRDLMPYAPAQLRADGPLGAGSDVTITWVRQTRVGGADWNDGWAVPPLSEDEEAYELEVLDSDGEVVRTETGITEASFTYTTAMHAADGPVVAVRAWQISAQVGRGFPATLAIPTINAIVEVGENIAEGQSGSGTSNFAGNDIFAQRYDGIIGHVLSLSAYLGSSASGSMTMALYADDGDEPGALIAETEEKPFTATSSGHWEEFAFASPSAIGAGVKYWIACHGSASVNSRGSDGSNQNDRRRFKSQSYASGPPDPFGTASSYNNTRGLKMKVQT